MYKKFGTILLIFFISYDLHSDELINITDKTEPHNGGIWSFRIDKFKDERLRLFRTSNDTNNFKLLTSGSNHKYIDLGNGTYKIIGGILADFKLSEGKHELITSLEKQIGKLYKAENDLVYSYYINFEPSNLKMWIYTDILIGKERVVQDIPVIIIDEGGWTLDNVKVRVSPSINSKSVTFYDKNDSFEYIPKNRYVYVKARTKDKFKVQNWNNYWYLIQGSSFSEVAVDLVQTKYVWAFGEFIRHGIYQDEKGNKFYPNGTPYKPF